MWYVPVIHEGNQSYSVEEVDRVESLVECLTTPGSSWTDRHGFDGASRPVARSSLLLRSTTRNRLSERLAGVQVGIAGHVPASKRRLLFTRRRPPPGGRSERHGVSLQPESFQRRDITGACACLSSGAPLLLSPECRTPRQMELANALCRYEEISEIAPMGITAALG